MKFPNVLLVIILSFATAFVTARYVLPHNGNEAVAVKESVYDRVMRTGTIRCGYADWNPLLIKDPNTGKLSGIAYDYVEAMGKALNLKVEWAEEVGWGDFPVALETGKIDAFCTGAWPTASRARQVDFVRPIIYQAVYAYVRADDHRFDNNLAAIDDPTIAIAAMDGEMSSLIAASDFPKAKTTQVPQLANISELLLNVVDKKADVTFTDTDTAAQYDAKNPGKIRRVSSKAPLRFLGDPLVIARGQDQLRRMFDIATDELLSSGKIEKITTKYERFPGTLLRVAPLYQ